MSKFVMIALACALIVNLFVPSLPAQEPPSPGSARPLSEIVRCVKPAVVFISTARTDGKQVSGTGFIISRDGYLLTAYHVVEKARRIFVRLPNGHREEARLVRKSEYIDSALLKLSQGLNYPRVTLLQGAASQGEEVLVFGYPGGRSLGLSDVTVTRGIVSAFRGPVGMTSSIIQIDASINPGNSGGPVVGLDTLVVGTAFASSQQMSGVNFAVSIGWTEITLLIPGLLGGEMKQDARVRGWHRNSWLQEQIGPPPCD